MESPADPKPTGTSEDEDSAARKAAADMRPLRHMTAEERVAAGEDLDELVDEVLDDQGSDT